MTFYQWLRHQIERDDEVGELAAYVEQHDDFPTEGTTKQFIAYLKRMEMFALIAPFNDAWKEWVEGDTI